MEYLDFVLFLPVLVLAVVVHEVAHAWVARREGDDTAEKQGRITLNPLSHIDPVGTVVVPAVLWFATGGGFIFGWARPVPVDPSKYRDPKWSDVRVSLAGIAANLAMAVGFLALAWGAAVLDPGAGALAETAAIVRSMSLFGVFFNLLLAFFNLIPIPPLDGSHVLYHLLPRHLRAGYHKAGRYGLLVLMALLFLVPDVLRILLWPVDALFEAARSFIGLWT